MRLAAPTREPEPGAPLGLLRVAPPLDVAGAATPPSDWRYSTSEVVSTWRICEGRTAIVAPPEFERAKRTLPRSLAKAVALS